MSSDLNPFDRSSRFQCKLDDGTLIAWLLAPIRIDPLPDLEFLGWGDANRVTVPGLSSRVNDTLVLMLDRHANGRPWAVIIEAQIDPDPKMLARLMVYMGLLMQEPQLLPPEYTLDQPRGDRCEIASVVINLRGHGQCGHTNHLIGSSHQFRYEPCEWNLSELDAGVILAGYDTGNVPELVLPWQPLMQNGNDDDKIKAWCTIVEAMPERVRRGHMVALATTYASAVGTETLWREATKEMDVIKSSVVEEWKDEARVQQGRDFVIDVLTARFTKISTKLLQSIRAIDDPDRLKMLLIAAATVESIEAFTQRLAASELAET